MPTAVGTEYIEVDGYPLSNHAVRILDHTALWSLEYRPERLSAPYVHGGLSYPSWLGVPGVVLPGIVVGEVDSDGTPVADSRAGLTANMDELYAAVLAPVDTGDGTRVGEWHRGDGTVHTASVQVTGFDIRHRDAGAVNFSLTLAVIEGRWSA